MLEHGTLLSPNLVPTGNARCNDCPIRHGLPKPCDCAVIAARQDAKAKLLGLQWCEGCRGVMAAGEHTKRCTYFSDAEKGNSLMSDFALPPPNYDPLVHDPHVSPNHVSPEMEQGEASWTVDVRFFTSATNVAEAKGNVRELLNSAVGGGMHWAILVAELPEDVARAKNAAQPVKEAERLYKQWKRTFKQMCIAAAETNEARGKLEAAEAALAEKDAEIVRLRAIDAEWDERYTNLGRECDRQQKIIAEAALAKKVAASDAQRKLAAIAAYCAYVVPDNVKNDPWSEGSLFQRGLIRVKAEVLRIIEQPAAEGASS